jgi:hypothetical protein
MSVRYVELDTFVWDAARRTIFLFALKGPALYVDADAARERLLTEDTIARKKTIALALGRSFSPGPNNHSRSLWRQLGPARRFLAFLQALLNRPRMVCRVSCLLCREEGLRACCKIISIAST